MYSNWRLFHNRGAQFSGKSWRSNGPLFWKKYDFRHNTKSIIVVITNTNSSIVIHSNSNLSINLGAPRKIEKVPLMPSVINLKSDGKLACDSGQQFNQLVRHLRRAGVDTVVIDCRNIQDVTTAIKEKRLVVIDQNLEQEVSYFNQNIFRNPKKCSLYFTLFFRYFPSFLKLIENSTFLMKLI